MARLPLESTLTTLAVIFASNLPSRLVSPLPLRELEDAPPNPIDVPSLVFCSIIFLSNPKRLVIPAVVLVSLLVVVSAELLPVEYSSMTIVMISLTCFALLSVKSEFFAFSPGQMDPVGGGGICSFGTGTGSSFFTILIFEEHPATTNKKRIPSNTMLSGRVVE